MAILLIKGHPPRYIGLSSDVKPVIESEALLEAEFIETDTKLTYVYTGEEWVEKTATYIPTKGYIWNSVSMAWEAESTARVIPTTSVANSISTGTIDALNEVVECTVSPGASTIGCQLTGTWAAVGDLISFEGTVDGTNWTAIYANLTSVGSLAVTVSGSNGIYQIAGAGMAKVRVRGSTWGTPGSCSVSFNASVGSSASLLALPLPVGSNIIGKVGIDQTTPGTTNAVAFTNTSINIGTVTTLPAITGAVTATQGSPPWTMDVTKVAGESIQVAGGTEEKSIRVTIATDSTGLLSVDDNGGSLTVDAVTLPLPTGAALESTGNLEKMFALYTHELNENMGKILIELQAITFILKVGLEGNIRELRATCPECLRNDLSKTVN